MSWFRSSAEPALRSTPSPPPIQGKVNLSLCLTNWALRHEEVWGSRCIDPIFLTSALVRGAWSATCPCRFTLGERPPVHIGFNSRGGLDDVEKRKFWILAGLKIWSLGRPARSQSLYRIRYPGPPPPIRFVILHIFLRTLHKLCSNLQHPLSQRRE
jgi:hypothetical protein